MSPASTAFLSLSFSGSWCSCDAMRSVRGRVAALGNVLRVRVGLRNPELQSNRVSGFRSGLFNFIRSREPQCGLSVHLPHH